MRKMNQSSCLISGIDGLGIEIAKNVVLSGIKRVVLHDRKKVTISDLSSQFFLRKEDIGKNRAEASFKEISELNPYVSVEYSTDALTSATMLQHQVVVLCNHVSYKDIDPIADFCHQHDIKLVIVSTRGLFGQIFCDFGDSFIVTDPDGEEPEQRAVESIAYDNVDGIVTLTESSGRGFNVGDLVIFSNVRGAEKINHCGPIVVKSRISPHVFSIGDTTGFGKYEGGGVCTLAKKPVEMNFMKFRTSFTRPKFVTSDFAKIERQDILHLTFFALGRYYDRFSGRLPEPDNEEHAENFREMCLSISPRNIDLSTADFFNQFAHQCAAQLAPINAVVGGVAAQEVIKAVSGKFTPINQWFYFDAKECIQGNANFKKKVQETNRESSRYDSETIVFGDDFVERLKNLKVFLCGSGALGCELLKNFAMMGIGTGPSGKVIVTDMDLIERSNLNRQFLFRENDVGKAKSEVAAQSCKKMNDEMNIIAHRNRIGPETEDVYNDEFFQHIDIVVNALDNIEARKYVDARCVLFRKPLLESGTLGTKGNTQVILPQLTESYSSSNDPPEKSFPICTVKNFPYLIEHTLQWAREMFDSLFKMPMLNVKKYLETNNTEFAAHLEKMDHRKAKQLVISLKKALVEDRPFNFEQCVRWARLLWEESFVNQSKQLLHTFPPEYTTSEGAKFWSGSKRLPTVLEFDVENVSYIFVYTLYNF